MFRVLVLVSQSTVSQIHVLLFSSLLKKMLTNSFNPRLHGAFEELCDTSTGCRKGVFRVGVFESHVSGFSVTEE